MRVLTRHPLVEFSLVSYSLERSPALSNGAVKKSIIASSSRRSESKKYRYLPYTRCVRAEERSYLVSYPLLSLLFS